MAKTKIVDAWSFKVFKRTDVQSRHVVIFAHGTSKGCGSFTVPQGKTIRHYVSDGLAFRVDVNVNFPQAMKGELSAVDTSGPGEITPDYKLVKAAGRHLVRTGPVVLGATPQYLPAKDQLATYDRLLNFVRDAGAIEGSQAPDELHSGLGLGVPCDIVSIRNRLFFHGLGNKETTVSLRWLVNHSYLRQYTHVHCFFCRVSTSEGAAGDRPRTKANAIYEASRRRG